MNNQQWTSTISIKKALQEKIWEQETIINERHARKTLPQSRQILQQKHCSEVNNFKTLNEVSVFTN